LSARGQKWKELSDLLPNVTAQVSEHVAQDNLAARGLRFPDFQLWLAHTDFDARVYLKQSVWIFPCSNGYVQPQPMNKRLNTAIRMPAIW